MKKLHSLGTVLTGRVRIRSKMDRICNPVGKNGWQTVAPQIPTRSVNFLHTMAGCMQSLMQHLKTRIRIYHPKINLNVPTPIRITRKTFTYLEVRTYRTAHKTC